MNMLRIFEQKIVRKICGPKKEGESWRIRTNKEIKDILQGTDVVNFITFLQQKWYGHVKKMKTM